MVALRTTMPLRQQFPPIAERPDNRLQDHAPMANFAVYSGQDG